MVVFIPQVYRVITRYPLQINVLANVPEDSANFVAGLLLHVGRTDQVQNIAQMVNVPIGGPDVQFPSGQDVNMSPRGGSFQSYVMKMRDNGTGHSMLGSDFLANSPPPREVITKRELLHNQHSGAQLDRYKPECCECG